MLRLTTTPRTNVPAVSWASMWHFGHKRVVFGLLTSPMDGYQAAQHLGALYWSEINTKTPRLMGLFHNGIVRQYLESSVAKTEKQYNLYTLSKK